MNKIKQNNSMFGVWDIVVAEEKTGHIVRKNTYKNLLPQVGRAGIAKQLAGTNTQELEIQHIAVGTGSTAVNNSDTKMEFEVARKAKGSGVDSGVEASVAAFFASADIPDKTYTRAAAFGDGADTVSSASADSGLLFSHVAILETISATQTLTLTFRISVNDGGA